MYVKPHQSPPSSAPDGLDEQSVYSSLYNQNEVEDRLSARSYVHSNDGNPTDSLHMVDPNVHPPNIDQWNFGPYAPGLPRDNDIPELILQQDLCPEYDPSSTPYGAADATQDILDENKPTLPIPSPDIQMFPGRQWIGNSTNESPSYSHQMQSQEDDALEFATETDSFLSLPAFGQHRRWSTGGGQFHNRGRSSVVHNHGPEFSSPQYDFHQVQPSPHSSAMMRTVSSNPVLPTQTIAQSPAQEVAMITKFICGTCKTTCKTGRGLKYDGLPLFTSMLTAPTQKA
jgi:hypothetical protein